MTPDPLAPVWMAQPELGRPGPLRAIIWSARTLGRRFTRLLLHPAAVWVLLFKPDKRASSRAYLRRILGREPRLADIYRHYHAFASVTLDRVYLLNGDFGLFDVRIFNEDVVREIAARGEGAFLLSAHLGSFEMLRWVGREAHAPTVRIIMYEEMTRYLNGLLGEINPSAAQGIIGLGEVDSMLKVERALARGEFVGMLADRTIQAGGTITLPFLGVPAAFPLGPFRIAAIMKRPVVLIFGIYRGDNRYDVHFEPLVDLSAVPRAERDTALEEAVRKYVGRLEHYCRLAPFNWFNFYDFWR